MTKEIIYSSYSLIPSVKLCEINTKLNLYKISNIYNYKNNKNKIIK